MKRTSPLLLVTLASALGGCNQSANMSMPDMATGDLSGPLMGIRPPGRKDIDAIVIPSTKKMLVYGGDQAPPTTAIPAPKVFVDDLWRLDLASGAWEKLQPTNTAGPRGGYAAAFDGKRNRMIVVGGRLGTEMSPPIVGDVWALDVTTLVWTQLMPTGTAPSARVGHRVVYDATGDRLLMVGGDTSKIFGNGIVGD